MKSAPPLLYPVGALAEQKTFFYKRARFNTSLPVDYFYSPSHAWIANVGEDVWRVGLTKFATRMLGEIVDHGFNVAPNDAVQPGQTVGWIEGFKAISDLFCIAEGTFIGGNPILKENAERVGKDPYEDGWLYEIKGKPDAKCIDLQGYTVILDAAIDRILAQEKNNPDE